MRSNTLGLLEVIWTGCLTWSAIVYNRSPSPDQRHDESSHNSSALTELSHPTFSVSLEARAPYLPEGSGETHIPGNFTKSLLLNLPGIAQDVLLRRERTTPPQVARMGLESLSCDVDILRFSVTIPNLPESFAGFTVLHATDLHLAAEDQTPLLRLQSVFQALTRSGQRPDCLIVTGDFVHRSYTECSQELLSHLRDWIRDGVPVFYVLGNHDNRDQRRAELKTSLDTTGALDITNSEWSMRRGDEEIRLLGLDDHTTGVPQAPASCLDRSVPRILALHNPEGFPDSLTPYLSLILAGHIHQGEVRFSFSRDGAHYFDGISIMKRDPSSGYTDRFAIQDWAVVNGVPLYVSAGLARRWEHKGFPYSLRKRHPGCSVALHTLQPT